MATSLYEFKVTVVARVLAENLEQAESSLKGGQGYSTQTDIELLSTLEITQDAVPSLIVVPEPAQIVTPDM